MKPEEKMLIVSMINNLIISIIKIAGGFVFKLNSLFADGLHTLSDFITDIISILTTKVEKRKPTKHHPFGFGRVEYLSNLFIGMLLFALGISIIIGAFTSEKATPPIMTLVLLAVVFTLKLLAILAMNKLGKKINSQILITSVEESKTDLFSTIGVFFITILLQFSEKFPILEHSDMIGSIIIALIIFKTALKIIVANSFSIIGETENNKELEEKVRKLIYTNKKIKKDKQEFMKYGSYYKLHLTLELDENIKLKDITKLEKRIKNTIVRHRSLKIRYVSIYITDKI